MTTTDCDLLVVGGGPAGLCAAINGASEGLRVSVLDSAMSLGGQAKQSNAIENYPLPAGYPDGVTGETLMRGFVTQALKFDTNMFCPFTASKLAVDGDRIHVVCDDYTEFASKAVILSIGLNYRRHSAKGIGTMMGCGVFYGLPPGNTSLYTNKVVGVVGGANSAGQAVLKLAANAKTTVKLIVRKGLADQMSTYLIDRIRASANIEVCEHCEGAEVRGTKRLEEVIIQSGQQTTCDRMDYLFMFIGATPQTMWLQDTLALDQKRFIVANDYQTSVPNVFVAGDVRAGSTKRISAAIGEGSAALQKVHQALARG